MFVSIITQISYIKQKLWNKISYLQINLAIGWVNFPLFPILMDYCNVHRQQCSAYVGRPGCLSLLVVRTQYASASVAEIQNANPTIAIQLWELTTNSARQKNCAIIGHWLGNSDRKIMTDRWMVSWDSVMSVAGPPYTNTALLPAGPHWWCSILSCTSFSFWSKNRKNMQKSK